MSYSEFTQQDYALIQSEYEGLMEVARQRCKDDEETALVQKAFDFANEAHKNVRRRSGEPYIIHPIQVARIVVEEIGLGCKSIVAALLHDVVEDTDYTVEDISNLFGPKIASLVDGLTKIKTVLDNEDRKGTSMHTESLQAENFKRILLTLGDDVKVVLIKLADRLHNCRTIEFMPEHKRDKILSETMFLFIPLAHRLGLYGVKTEMENIWLKFKEPDAYRDISARINKNVEERDREIDEFIAPIKEALDEKGFDYQIKKRIKTPYSIWYKMRTKQVPFEQIYDLYAVRIIFINPDETSPEAERRQAYNIYLTLTDIYREQPGRTRDWIKQPKNNGYEALHCTLMSKAGIWVEVQIRSRRMDDIAEKGIAAHWAYKKDGYISENDSEMDKWLARIQGILVSKDLNDLELLDIIHKDLISSEITVFTPRGEQKSIATGATVLDFAYSIHSHIGNKAIAAKVNMKLAPLSQVLKSGDQVEIITAVNTHPKMEWLKFLQTRYAKGQVVEYFRSQHDKISEEGEKIFNARLETLKVKPSNEIIRKFLDYCQLNDTPELYFRVGVGLLGTEDFLKVINDHALNRSAGKYIISAPGTGSYNYVMAECCSPIPGDPVIGFLSGKDTIILHKKSCQLAESLATKYGNRVIVPQWLINDQEYPIRVSLKGIDRLGLLNEITQLISRTMEVNMRKLQLGVEDGVFEGYIELLVRDKSNMESMLEGLKKIEGIQEVERTEI